MHLTLLFDVQKSARTDLEELFLHVDSNFAVRGRVGDASKNKAISNLVIVKEGLFGLVDASANNLSGAGGASSGTATVGELNSGFLGSINNEDIIGAVDGGVNVVFSRDQLDRVSKGGGGRGTEANRGEGLGNRDGKESNQGLGEHGD